MTPPNPAGGTPTTSGRRFLTPSGYTSKPPREVPRETSASRHLDLLRASAMRDEQELVAAACTLRDEPECIGRSILNGYTESARFHQTLRHQQTVAAARAARPLLPAEDRLVDAMARAKRSHVNLSGEFHVIGVMLAAAARGGRKPPRNALVRLERVEAQLDGVSLAV